MPDFKSKEEYEKWKTEKVKSNAERLNEQKAEQTINPEKAETKKSLSEIRYTCNSCGNIWHKLPFTESKAGKRNAAINAGIMSCALPCCFPIFAGAYSGVTQQAKMCIKCHSQNVKREVIEYDEEGNPK